MPLFCYHCGESMAIPFPIAIDVFTAMGKAFEKMHKHCDPMWKEPFPDMELTADARAQFWLKNGEHGISSETIFYFMTGHKVATSFGHPSDPSDFHRCYKLLKMVPEWKAKLPGMAQLGKEWAGLVEHWEELEKLLEEQIATGKDNGMYKRMREVMGESDGQTVG